jgi:putative DNA primase/helicase
MTQENSSGMAAHSRPKPRPYLSIVAGLGLDAVKAARTVTSKKVKASSRIAGTAAANDDTIPESSRNNTLASLAGMMRRKGMSAEAIDAALQVMNLQKCTPPLDPSEVTAIANSIGRYAAANSDDILQTLNDTGNAARFARKHEDETMFVFGLGWYLWDGLRWVHDSVRKVVEWAKVVARSIYDEAVAVDDGTARDKVLKHAKSSLNAPRLKACIELAQSVPELVASAGDLDSHEMLLGVANGVIDLTTGKLRRAQRTDLLTRHSPVVFDAKAKAPRFVTFIDEITGSDKKLAAYIQRVIGYALTGTAREQCLFFFHGSGANGKSVLLNVVKEVLGDDLAKQTPPETLMAKRSAQTNDIARLQNLRVVIANEVEDGNQMAEALVKQMSGGDSMTARFHYQEFFDFTPKFKLFIAGNHKPVIQGRDNGIWRRIRLIPFDVTIPPDKRDKHLQEKLRAELPGILNWAVKGCLAWQRQGLAEPAVVTTAVDAYRAEMDVIQQWTSECCTMSPAAEWKSSEAYYSYRNWAQDSGYKPLSLGNFSRDLEKRFSRVKRKDANYFVGITGR